MKLAPCVPQWSLSWHSFCVKNVLCSESLFPLPILLCGKDTLLNKLKRAGSFMWFECTKRRARDVKYALNITSLSSRYWTKEPHLWILSPAACWLQGIGSLDNLLGCGGGLVRGVVWTLLHHVLTLLTLWCGRAWAFTQDWWASGCALVWVTGSAERKESKKEGWENGWPVRPLTFELNQVFNSRFPLDT